MITNRQLILPYAAPYLAYVGIANIPVEYLPAESSYILQLITVPLILCWTWRWYCPLKGPYSPLSSILFGAGAGLIGLIIWITLLAPFVSPVNKPPWSFNAFLLRLLSAGLIVPLFEELMMRGFVFRLTLQWDNAQINNEEPGNWSWWAVILSTVVFTWGTLCRNGRQQLHMGSLWPYSGYTERITSPASLHMLSPILPLHSMFSQQRSGIIGDCSGWNIL